MERYLAHYRRLIAASELDPSHDEVQHKWLLKLLADEIAKGAASSRDRRY
jgi:hypothetical protein